MHVTKALCVSIDCFAKPAAETHSAHSRTSDPEGLRIVFAEGTARLVRTCFEGVHQIIHP